MVSSAGAYRCVALDHVGFELTATPSLIEQGRKKYERLMRAVVQQQSRPTVQEPPAQAWIPAYNRVFVP